MSTQNNMTARLAKSMKEAGMAVLKSVDLSSGVVHQIETDACCEQPVFLGAVETRGICLTTHVDVPRSAGIRGLQRHDADALVLLGALTAALRDRGLEAHLACGPEGLEAVVIERRICADALDAKDLQATHLPSLTMAAAQVAKGLDDYDAAHPRRLIDALRVPESALNAKKVEGAAVTPTFDLAARDRLMKHAEE